MKKKKRCRLLILKENLAVRLPHWTDCVVEIQDIGSKSFWGRVIDIKTNEVVAEEKVFPFDDGWEVALDVKTVIANL
jgi:hypothetical protein